MKKNIAVHLAEGFEEVEAVSIIDVLRRAEFDVKIISVTEDLEITGNHGITIKAEELFKDFNYENIDMIVLPGGMPGAKHLKEHAGLREKVLDFEKKEKPIGAICAAPMVLGAAGLLRNKNATCFPGFEDELKGANVTGNEVEVDGKIITGKGPGVAIKFALQIVEFLTDEKTANKVANKMIATR